jgi:hypothetical protein
MDYASALALTPVDELDYASPEVVAEVQGILSAWDASLAWEAEVYAADPLGGAPSVWS